jgi:hypothetical protein
MDIKYPQVTVELVGHDGNAFGIIAKVHRQIAANVSVEAAQEFQDQAFACESYEDLLRLCMVTVDVA